jgi:hypothetical protein
VPVWSAPPSAGEQGASETSIHNQVDPPSSILRTDNDDVCTDDDDVEAGDVDGIAPFMLQSSKLSQI